MSTLQRPVAWGSSEPRHPIYRPQADARHPLAVGVRAHAYLGPARARRLRRPAVPYRHSYL
ncbi:MAG: hypothetical protein MZV70_54505 [Desulfobacterales bacterium]|nr:hypothetical protein [Desulfobacterales bacterium]